MPCDTIRTTQIDMGKLDAPTLTTALNRMGLGATNHQGLVSFSGGTYNVATGQLDARSNRRGFNADSLKNNIRKAYSGEVIRSQAKRFGWQVKELGNNKFEVVKRSL